MNSKTEETLLVDSSHLHPVFTRPGFISYIGLIWSRRHFILLDAKSRAFNTGNGTFLGKFWILLNPAFQVAVYALVFGVILKTTRGIDNFVGFLTIGVIYFGFFSKGLNGGVNLIQKSRSFLSTFSFPAASLVFSLNLRQFIDNLAPATVAVIFALLLQPKDPPNFSIFGLIPLYILISVFNIGLTFIVARATAFIPDLKSILNVFTRGLFFISGVFYSVERFSSNTQVEKIVEYNPIYTFLQCVRQIVLDGQLPSLATWTYLSVWTIGLSTIGILYFWQAENRYVAS
ncbi:ABC transporter permease [Corynebacterium sp.]|uniref:ABC transporter permease n=1 Tax=Corynebacterium sp. TaxID=1720 RepID=UPI0026DD619B|nr:ABC transporter permease [Corynebacterium sp.]MDO5031016.1 ABC transporter permease [Corynebacterium sp.]